jgi:hypothetical protein
MTMGAVHVSLVHGIRLVVGSSLSVLTADEADEIASALRQAAIELRAKMATLAVVESPERPVSWS